MSYDALKRLLSEATQGTWRLEGDQRIVDIGGSTVARGPLLFTKEDRANLELIAALRNAAPALLAENERLRAALEKYADGSNWGSADYEGDDNWWLITGSGYDIARAALARPEGGAE